MPYTTLIFLTAIATGVVLNLWLLSRHSRHVAAHRHAVPADFVDSISIVEHQTAADYTLAKVRLERIDLIFRTLIILIWTVGGGLDYIFQLWLRTNLNTLWAESLAILSVLLIGMVLDLPLSLWRTFYLEQKFGFNRSSIALFFRDILIGIGIGIILGGPLIIAILWLMKQAGTLWWLYAWGVWMIFTLLMLWIIPTFIDPLFNQFTPLEAGELRTRIETLIHKCGFNSQGIFMMDGSKRSSHSNAYFTGMGKTKRIVLFDTLITRLTIEELEAVLAHELGHYKHKHIQIRLLLSAVLTLGGFYLLWWLSSQSWFYRDLGITNYSDGSILLLFSLVLPIFMQFLSPLMGWLLRYHEYQADAFAVAYTNGKSLVQALVKLYKDNAGTLTPDPLFSAFNDSHPPASLRIERIKQS